MTVIMAYSIYAVRISSDIPVQSNYIPVIKFFFYFIKHLEFISNGLVCSTEQLQIKRVCT